MSMKAPASTAEPGSWDEWLLCIFLHLTVPLLPLLFEVVTQEHIRADVLVLLLAMYSLALANTTRSKAVFGLYLTIGVSACMVAGVVEHEAPQLSLLRVTWATLGVVFITQMVERYIRHKVRSESYLEFLHDR